MGARGVEGEVVAHDVTQIHPIDRALDGGPPGFTVALGSVAIADRNQRARDRDRKVERAPGNKLLAVEVADGEDGEAMPRATPAQRERA